MKKYSGTLILVSLILLSACSLKYVETPVVEDTVPEFVFENTQMVSYESNKKKTQVEAERLEQYKNSSESYAKGVHFQSFSNKGELESEGSCGLLFADQKKEMYRLFDDISLLNNKEKTNFYADALQWNGKSEQLTSGKSTTVRIEKDDTVIRGSGFSASGVSKTFSFTGAVSGDIETK